MEFTTKEVEKENELKMQVHTHITKAVLGYISSMSLKCAVELSIPDIIHNHGKPISLTTLVDSLSLPPSKTTHLNSLMRYLVHSGFFTMQKLDEDREEEGFWLTPFSSILIKGTPNTMSSVVLALIDPVKVTPFHFLSDWFKGNGNGSTAFESVHGKSFFNYLEKNPEYGKTFDDAMSNKSKLEMGIIVNEGKEVFENLKSMVDVGGGIGITAQAISEAFPQMKCIVFDLPNVISKSPKNTETIEFIGGDMFESVPKADAILLKTVLHDWNDDDCIKILKKCKEALPNKGGKVIVVEIVLEQDKKQEHEITEAQLLVDIMMMTTFASKERTEIEWKKLFMDSGFTHYKITSLNYCVSIIEVYP